MSDNLHTAAPQLSWGGESSNTHSSLGVEEQSKCASDSREKTLDLASSGWGQRKGSFIIIYFLQCLFVY